MRIIQTDCTQEQIEQDLPELERLNAEAMETEFAGISRFEFLEVIPDIRKATKTYRNEGRPICRDAGLW